MFWWSALQLVVILMSTLKRGGVTLCHISILHWQNSQYSFGVLVLEQDFNLKLWPNFSLNLRRLSQNSWSFLLILSFCFLVSDCGEVCFPLLPGDCEVVRLDLKKTKHCNEHTLNRNCSKNHANKMTWRTQGI